MRRRTTVNSLVREGAEALTISAVQPDPEMVAKYGPGTSEPERPKRKRVHAVVA